MGTLNRIKAMMLQPEADWDADACEMPGSVVLLRSFLLPLAPLATIIGMLIVDTRWNPEYGSMLRDRAPMIALGTYVFEIASVFVWLIAVNSRVRVRLP